MRTPRRILCVVAAAALTHALSCQAKTVEVHGVSIAYTVKDHFITCPPSKVPEMGCVLIQGLARISDAKWGLLRRVAIVYGPSPAVPKHCAAASTSGSLKSQHHTVDFKGKGYYCPDSDTARYVFEFVGTEAKDLGLHGRGTIIYDGHTNTEIFTFPLTRKT